MDQMVKEIKQGTKKVTELESQSLGLQPIWRECLAQLIRARKPIISEIRSLRFKISSSTIFWPQILEFCFQFSLFRFSVNPQSLFPPLNPPIPIFYMIIFSEQDQRCSFYQRFWVKRNKNGATFQGRSESPLDPNASKAV